MFAARSSDAVRKSWLRKFGLLRIKTFGFPKTSVVKSTFVLRLSSIRSWNLDCWVDLVLESIPTLLGLPSVDIPYAVPA